MSAPTIYHTSVMLQPSVDALAIQPGGVYVDATFGGGGHTRAILSQLGPTGRVFAFDQDSDARSNAPEDNRFMLITENFRWMSRFLRLHGSLKADGILADLGVSSHQFDTGDRGFSTRYDGPMDMRMDNRTDQTAGQIVASYKEADLHRIFEEYGEVRNARQLARHIANTRNKGTKLASIEAFKSFIAPVIIGNPNRYLAQVFQSLRIEVNEEMDSLKALLMQSAACLNPGGRLAVISFHSLEDRLVKRFMKWGAFEEPAQNDGFLPLAKKESPFRIITSKPVEPTEAEQRHNPRSRSARLRVAEKL